MSAAEPALDIQPPRTNHDPHANPNSFRLRALNPFPPEALQYNRRGELAVTQREGFARTLRLRNRRATIAAAVLFAGAVPGRIPGASLLRSGVARRDRRRRAGHRRFADPADDYRRGTER